DIHKDDGNPGVWSVYHTDKETNSLCTPLSECLKQLQQFHYANPNHAPVTIVLELKEIFEDNFDEEHTPEDLDRVLETYLGAHLYTPTQFLSRCPSGATMLECAKQQGWPTLAELQGKFIFSVIGNWHTCVLGQGIGHGPKGWADYATWGAGTAARAAFPMRSDFSDFTDTCHGDYVDPSVLQQAS